MSIMESWGKTFIFFPYIILLAVFLGSSVFSLGPVYIAINLLFAISFHFIQKNGFDMNIFRLLKSIIFSSIGMVFFFRVLPYDFLTPLVDVGYFYVGFALMGSMMNYPILPNSRFSHISNLLVILLMLVIGYGMLYIVFEPYTMLMVYDKISALSVYFVVWFGRLLLIISANHLLGRDCIDLLGKRRFSISDFILYFMIGVSVFCLMQAFSFFVFSKVFSGEILLVSVNFVSWGGASYLFYQSMTFICTMIQTLVEEIVMRSLLVKVWDACGFGELDQETSKWKYVLKLIVMSCLMSAWFSATHLRNPIERGRVFGSMFEKFVVYFENVSWCMAYLLTGNIAYSWGMHFMHNYAIRMYCFSPNAVDNGFFQYNVQKSALTSAQVMKGSLAKMASGVILVLGGYYYGEHIKRCGDKNQEVNRK